MFSLKAKLIEVETGGIPVIVLNEVFAKKHDIHGMDRVMVTYGNNFIVASVDLSEKMMGEDEIGIFEESWLKLKVREGDIVKIDFVGKPESTKYIRKKMDKEELFDKEIYQIVKDIVDDKLTDVELTAFVSASYMGGLSLEESYYLTKAIVETGGRLKLNKRIILDKHCIGGVPGNRTTMVIVPIVASLGYYMPKTSSRSITSPSGTADTMEALCDVSFSIEELTNIVKKTKGCIVWGGAINLAAADDKLIRVRHPISLDPEGMMLASIIAKKKAVGTTHVIFDLPIGEDAKLSSLGEARHLEREFIKLSEKFKMKVDTLITDGNEPIGRGIGPNLEARDVLWLLKNDKKQPYDLRKKATMLAGKLLELCGAAPLGKGEETAEKQLANGQAYKKMMEIIEAQGGDPKLKPEDLPVAEYTCEYEAETSGRVYNINNGAIAKIARAAGSPVDNDAGIFLYKHYNDIVKKGEKIFTVYSRSERNIERAIKLMSELNPVIIK